jgi:hypothetical protein
LPGNGKEIPVKGKALLIVAVVVIVISVMVLFDPFDLYNKINAEAIVASVFQVPEAAKAYLGVEYNPDLVKNIAKDFYYVQISDREFIIELSGDKYKKNINIYEFKTAGTVFMHR